MIRIFSGITAGIAIVLLSEILKKDSCFRADISIVIYRSMMIILTAVFAFLLIYRIEDIPLAYNIDEAGMAYDALNIVNHHTDRHLYHFPVYFVSYGDGQSALYTYLAAGLIRLFGYSIVIVRLPAVILSLLSVFVFFRIIHKSYGTKASLIVMALFCVLPFSIMHSRWGLDCYLFFPMLIISCAVLFHAVSSSDIRWFVFSGFAYGLTLYTYAISYMTVPLFLAIVLIYLLIIRKINLKSLFAMGIPLFLMAVSLLMLLAVNNGLIDEIRTRF